MKKSICTLLAVIALSLTGLSLTGCPADTDNGTTQPQTVAAPTANPPAGTYQTAQTVSLATTTQGAVMYYTLDGNNPTTSSTVYNSSFLIDHSLTLKAIAVKDGMNNSATLTAVYTIGTEIPPDTVPPVITDVTATPASVTLPAFTGNVTLNCTATSADGSAVKSIVWKVEEKPTGANPAISGNTATGLTVAGTYKFKVTVTGSNDVTASEVVTVQAGLYAAVSFVTLGTYPYPVTTLNFSPSSSLPTGVTYIITNDKTNKTYNNTGTVSATDFVDICDNVIFTQTFYLNGTEITGTGSKRTVKITADTFMGITEFYFVSDSGAVTLTYNLPPEGYTVKINLASFDLSAGVPTSLNLTPSSVEGITGALTFTLSETDEDSGASTSYFKYTDSSVFIDGSYVDYPSKHPRITQTFSYNGKEIGSFHFNLRAEDRGSGTQFYRVYRLSDGSTAYTSFPAAWSPLTFTITTPPEGYTVTVSFKSLAVNYPALAVDFSPSAALPTGVTYTLTDNRPTPNVWNSANGFNGQITAADYYTGADAEQINFTQTFYLNGVEITGNGNKRTVTFVVDDFIDVEFMSCSADSGAVTLTYNP